MMRRPTGRRRDDGSILPLVLVLIVISGLIVVPLLSYTIAVFRSNTVLTERTAAVEAAKGGVRIAVGDPRNVFQTCDDGGTLTALDPVINKFAVTVTCTEIAEYGPNEALGFEVPIAAVAMQAGARVPLEFSGLAQPPLLPVQSPAVPPYPDLSTTPDWWSGLTNSNPTNGTIWMPDLPRLPGAVRTSTPFSMPPAFVNCKVFFPGRYAAPLLLNGNNKYYFASGVYYFEAQVKVEGNADVVVGYGLDELPNPDCSDDIQVAANVVGTPGTFDISGGGATWVFGKEGRLVVDDVATNATLRLRFNQRYDTADRGGRISIMTVNGNDTVAAEHLVNNVNRVPRSKILNIVDNPEPTPDTVTTSTIDSGTARYLPSTSATSAAVPLGLTDKARVPAAPTTGFTAAPLRYFAGTTELGAILVTWNEVTGQAAGGAFIDGYNITIDGSVPTGCQPADLVVSVVAGVNKVSCLVKNLSFGNDYDVAVAARNWVGAGVPATLNNVRPRSSSSGTPSALITVPAAPTNVAAVDSNVDDVAQVSWTTPANGGAPITSYLATAHRIYLQPQPNQAPVANNTNFVMARGTTLTSGVSAFDPNGDALTLTVTGFPASAGTVTAAGRDVTITILPGASTTTHNFSYTVTDPSGLAVTRTGSVNVSSGAPSNVAPVANPMTVAANVGVPIVGRVPAFDPNANALTLTLGASTPPLDPLMWTVTQTGLDVTITTTAPDGTYSIPYSVTDGTITRSSTIAVTIVRGDETLGSCQVLAAPSVPLANVCEITGLVDLPPGDATSGNVGYRFDVTAVNAVGSSLPGSNPPPLPLAFNGGGVALPPPAVRTFEPWKPTPIIEILAHNADPADVRVAIAGYVAVPMGNVTVTNTDKDDVKINGGVMAGTYSVLDLRAGAPGSLPMGFKNDIVLQRKIKIVATARNITSVAIVQVNEDGASLGINSWVTQ